MRVMVPVRHGSWMTGDMGKFTAKHLRASLSGLADLRVARIFGGFVVQADEGEVCLVNRVAIAMREVEHILKDQYFSFYIEMGPLFSGEIQVVLDERPWSEIGYRTRRQVAFKKEMAEMGLTPMTTEG